MSVVSCVRCRRRYTLTRLVAHAARCLHSVPTLLQLHLHESTGVAEKATIVIYVLAQLLGALAPQKLCRALLDADAPRVLAGVERAGDRVQMAQCLAKALRLAEARAGVSGILCAPTD